MVRGVFIGSFSTKRAGNDRVDIEIIISIDPNAPLPNPMRLLLHCDATRVGHIIWQSFVHGAWVSLLQPPPYAAIDMGVLGQAPAPVPIPLTQPAGGGHSLYTANWAHHIHLEFAPNHPQLVFKYQPPPRGAIIQPPIHFSRLRLLQQIQTGTRAEILH